MTMFGGPLEDIRDAFKRIGQVESLLNNLRGEIDGSLNQFRKSMDGELNLVGRRYNNLAIDLLKMSEEIRDVRNKLAAIKVPARAPDIHTPANWPAWSALVLNAATLAAYMVWHLGK
jgi:hypothetical protein